MTNREARGSLRLAWLVVGVLSVVTAGWGLLDPGIYLGLIAPAARPGAFPITMAGLVPPTLLTVLFVGLAVLHLKRLSFGSIALTFTERGHSKQMKALSERSKA